MTGQQAERPLEPEDSAQGSPSGESPGDAGPSGDGAAGTDEAAGPYETAESGGDDSPGPAAGPEARPGSEEGSGFSQSDVGTPLVLPVVPLPEEPPLGGERMGSDFQGPATVPGASTPNQAAADSGPGAQAEDEPVPVMDWERE